MSQFMTSQWMTYRYWI